MISNRQGLIVGANDPAALADVSEWEPLQNPIEPEPFTTWHGVAPEGYLVVGHLLTTGRMQRPTPQQTAGIKAIREDLVAEMRVQRCIWSGRLPFDVVTLWDVVAVPSIFIATGAFVSKHGEDPANLSINIICSNA